MPSQTWVARFVVDHGRVTEEGGRLRTFQRRRLDEPETDLHIIAEPSGPKADDFGSQALEAIGRDFVKDTLSLTGGLLRALKNTNRVLLDWNRRSISRDQVSVGVSAAVVRGSVVYLAQVGPALVYLRKAGVLTRLVPQDHARVALGEGEIEPELRRIELQPGDVLIASSLAIESLVDEETLDALLERGTDSALPELYLATRDQPSFALFAISCLDGPDPEEEASPPEDGTESQPAGQPLGPSLAEATPAPPPPLTFEEQDQAETPPSLNLKVPQPLDISRPVVRLRNDQFSGRVDYPRMAGGGGPRFRLPAPRLLGISAAVGLAVFIAAFTVPDLIQQNRQQQTSALIGRALSAYSTFQQEQDPSRRRALLDETRRLASEALRIEPGNVQAAELRTQATAAKNQLDNLTDLGQLQTVTTLGKQVTGDVAIDSVVVANGNAYLLDSKGRRVILVRLTAPNPPSVVFEEGQTYGGAPARRPQFMTWDAVNNRLLVLDAERKLFEVRPDSAQPLALRRTAFWSSVAGIDAYDGNLYVLDPKANQVYKYLPAANGFDSEPVGLLPSQTVISNAKALSVQEDIFILGDDGKVRRFRSGSDVTLPLSGIDRPLAAPTSISAVPGADKLLIVDSGNKRLVVTTRDGVFLRQYVSNDFTDLRAVAYDARANQLFVAIGDALLTALLPP